MASDHPAAERAYPYWSGWHVTGCAVVFFGLVGTVGVALIPAGYERVQRNQLPTGVAMMVLGVLGIPTLAMSLITLFGGVRNTVRPPLLRVTATALVLPLNLRESSTAAEEDEFGAPKTVPPAHPAEVPFAAIRVVHRVGPPNPGSDKLVITYDLSAQPLVIEQAMMRAVDFDDLEAVLRAAVPV